MNLGNILGQILIIIVVFSFEAVIYKEAIYDTLLPLLDDPLKTLVGMGIAAIALVGNVIVIGNVLAISTE